MSTGADRRAFLLLLASAGLAMSLRAAPHDAIPLAKDLRADGRKSREVGAPIVILFSLPRCPYCEIVRRSHLAPMHRDPRQSGRVIIREIEIGGEHAVVGFRGERTTHGGIAAAHGMRAAPVVAFWDGSGKSLAESLTGMLLPDFYSAYLEDAIGSARSRLPAKS